MALDQFTARVYANRVADLRNQYNADLLLMEDELLIMRAEIISRMQAARGSAPTTGRAGESASMRAAALWYGIEDAADRELDGEITRRKDALLWRFQCACANLRRQLGVS